MKLRLSAIVAAALLLGACDVLFPIVPEPNLSGVGPSASEAAIEINYPSESPPLAVTYSDLAATWNANTVGAGVIAQLPAATEGDVTTASNDLSGAVIDVNTARDEVLVAQLFVQRGSRDSDEIAVAVAIDAFLRAVSDDLGPVDAARAALGLNGGLFVVREGEAVLGSVQLWLASNEDALMIGAIGR